MAYCLASCYSCDYTQEGAREHRNALVENVQLVLPAHCQGDSYCKSVYACCDAAQEHVPQTAHVVYLIPLAGAFKEHAPSYVQQEQEAYPAGYPYNQGNDQMTQSPSCKQESGLDHSKDESHWKYVFPTRPFQSSAGTQADCKAVCAEGQSENDNWQQHGLKA